MALEAKGGLGRLLLRHNADRERGAVHAAWALFRAAILHATVQLPLVRRVAAPAHDVAAVVAGAEGAMKCNGTLGLSASVRSADEANEHCAEPRSRQQGQKQLVISYTRF